MINYDWNEIVFKDKSELKKKAYIFIAGSREISIKRLTELIKSYLPKGNLLIGILKEEYIDGFEGQPHFKTMPKDKLNEFLIKLSKAKLPKEIDSIEYFQRDTSHIIEKIKPSKVIFINGSWNRMFHLRKEYYALAQNYIKHELISPFTNEKEAKDYYEKIKDQVNKQVNYSLTKKYVDSEIFEILNQEAKRSFATDFQTSCAIVKDRKIKILTHNEIIPFETFALHHGSVKEQNYSPANDLNHYDTNHAEMMMLINALKDKIDLKGTSLYINLMPCPTCARVLSQTGISEIVYSQDHSEGYAIKLFERMQINIRRYIF